MRADSMTLSSLWKVREPVTKELRNHFDGELSRNVWPITALFGVLKKNPEIIVVY